MSAKAVERIEELERDVADAGREIQRLQTESDDRQKRIDSLLRENTELGETKGDLERKKSELEHERDRFRVQAEAKQGTVEKLNEELARLKEELAKVDPATQAAREAEAERIRRETEEANREATEETERATAKAARAKDISWRFIAGGTALGVSYILLISLWLFGIEIPSIVWMGAPALLAAFVALSPTIISLATTIGPKANEHWLVILTIASLIFGAIVSSLSIITEGWLALVLWIVTAIGYGALLFGIIAGFVISEGKGWRKYFWLTPFVFIAAIMLSVFVPTSIPDSAALFLAYILAAIALVSVATFISILLGWVGLYVWGTFSGLRDRAIKGHRGIDVWLRRANALTVGASILVGIIVGMSLWPSDGEGTSSRVIAIAMGILLMTAYFLVEGKILEICFRRSIHGFRLFGLVLFGFLLASLTGYLTFSKLYAMGSSSQRYKAAQAMVSSAENSYLAAVEVTATQFAADASTTEEKDRYLNSLKEMKDAISEAGRANTYVTLEESVDKFRDAGSKVTDTLPRGKKDLLDKVFLSPEPHPTELGAQVFGHIFAGSGEEIYTGAAIMATAATFIVDYLICLFAIFALFIGRKADEMDAAVKFRVVSVYPYGTLPVGIQPPTNPDTPPSTYALIDGGVAAGVEVGDSINVLGGDQGQAIGTMTVIRSEGPDSSLCVITGNGAPPLNRSEICVV